MQEVRQYRSRKISVEDNGAMAYADEITADNSQENEGRKGNRRGVALNIFAYICKYGKAKGVVLQTPKKWLSSIGNHRSYYWICFYVLYFVDISFPSFRALIL